MSKKNQDRRSEIQKILIRQESVKVEELAEALHVTPETIRTDLNYLEQKGFLFRKHGGAALRTGNTEMPMDIRMQENTDVKKAISEAAFELIKDDMVLYFGASSTPLYLGRMLVLRKNLTVVTTSLDMIETLASGPHKIILLGGYYHRIGRSLSGESAREMVSEIHFDISFSGMNGCRGADGPCTLATDEIPIDKEAIRNSEMNVLMSDSSKFDMTGPFQYAQFRDFDILITDSHLKQADRERVKIRDIREV